MHRIEVLGAEDLQSGGWIEKILTLDRQNMTEILRKSGRAFPESRRSRVLRDPSLVVIAMVGGDELVGYVDFCTDARDDRDIYLTSIQLVPRYRRGMSIAKLLVAAARALKGRSFRYLRAEVQAGNDAALALCARLGFRIREGVATQASWDIIGDRTLLESEYFTRLLRRDR